MKSQYIFGIPNNSKSIEALCLIIFLIVMISIPQISAFSFDNVKGYDTIKKEITITNAFGLGAEIAKIQLVSDQVQYVMPGEDRMVAELLFKNYDKDYSNALNKMDFYDMNNKMNRFDREFTYKYWGVVGTQTIPITERACELRTDKDGKNEYCFDKVIGSEVVDKYEWIKFNSISELPGGSVRVGIFTDVKQDDTIEWIPTWFGESINEWAIWNAGLTEGLLVYYKLNETGFDTNLLESRFGDKNGTTTGNATFHPMVIGNGARFNITQNANVTNLLDMSIQNELTISAWINVTGWVNNGGIHFGTETTGFVGIRVLEGTSTINAEMVKGSSRNRTASDIALTANETYHVVAIFNGSATYLYINGTRQSTFSPVGAINMSNMTNAQSDTLWFADDGGGSITPLTADEVAIWNRSLSQSEITQLYNDGAGITYDPSPNELAISVEIFSPVDSLSTTESSLTFIGNITPTGGNVTNATLFIWYSNSTLFNKTTNILTGNNSNTTSFSISNIPLNDFIWNIRGCVENSSFPSFSCPFDNVNNANFTFTRTSIVNEGESFNTDAIETDQELFLLNISTLSDVVTVVTDLYYNGTKHGATTSCNSSGYCQISTTIDIPAVDSKQDKNLKWQLTTTNTLDATTFTNTTITYQNVSNFDFVLCNATITERYINFTIYDAINPNPALNSTFKSTFNFWLGNGTTKSNYSFENLTEETNSFEYCSGTPDRNITTNAEFEFDATGFSQNNHYYYRQLLNNVTKEQKLYLLNDSAATTTIVQLVDSLQRGLPDRLVEISLFDLGTGESKVVSMLKTDHDGEDVTFLNFFDSLYGFKIYYNGTLEESINPFKVSASPVVFIISPDVVFSQDKFKDVTYSLTFNNVTGDFVLIYNDPNSQIDGGCLRVVKTSANNYSTLSDVCLTTPSGTLTYNIGTNVTGRYLGIFYAKGSFNVYTVLEYFNVVDSIYQSIGNLDGTVMTIIMVGTGFMVGLVMGGPVIGILMLLGGYIVSIGLGFQSGSFGTSLVLIIAVGGLLMWKLKT